MGALKAQFFLLFGSFAAIQPYVALLFKERGLGEEEIGYALGISGWAIMLSPAVVTLLADTRVPPKRIMGGLSWLTAGATLVMFMSSSYWLLVGGYFMLTLCVTAMMPLLDGITFGVQRRQQEEGIPALDYSRIRVWGTFGYAAILILLFYPIRRTGEVSWAIGAGVFCYGILALNTRLLPLRGKRELAKRSKGLPTGEAARALFTGRTFFFSVAMFLLLCASAAYHTMYPVYLVEDLGLARHWIGIVIILGTVIEVFCIFALTRLEQCWGVRRLMLVCVGITVLRFSLMYGSPTLLAAIGTQVFHGAMICGMMVIPPNYLNGLANESNRNSIQGVYTMLVIGSSRFVGTAISGHVAAVDQSLIYLLCALLSLAAFGLLWKGLDSTEKPVVV